MVGGGIWKRGWGLGAELTISLVLLAVFSTGIFGLIMARLYQNDLLAAKTRELTVLANALALSVSADGALDERGYYYEALARQAGVDGVLLADRQGRAKVLFGRRPENAGAGRSLAAEALATGEIQARIVEGSFWRLKEPPLITVSVPMLSGSLELWSGRHDFLVHKRAIWLLLTASVFINGLAAYCFSRIFLNRRLIAPVRRLAQEMAALAEDRFQPGSNLAGLYSGEMGWLFNSFERTAYQLIQNREQLISNLETIKKAQNRLIQSEKMASVGRLAAGLAHELGNPLGAVVGMIYLLKRDDLTDQERRQFLDRSISELDRMGELIRSLLNFSRPSKAALEPLPLEPVIDEALALARHQKWFRGVEVERVAAGRPELVLAERNLLLQVLLNLLANAGQALADKKEPGPAVVKVSVSYGNGRAIVAVADNGPGIAAEDLTHLFEPFFTKKSPGEGTGLGLSISHSIITSFGGRLEARNGPEGGAELIFGLPVAEPAGALKEPDLDLIDQKGSDDDAN